ncbi:uncharacterized protein LOC126819183 [Patella vulgata]|uniref:uncharacterized protein LOC126819183 n=1 Tax=Patella vulgata TaxID=6465 RepID=UPI00217F6AF4|nr:uncharacterized protein LOC126819183 [Patella vulgata]
MWNTKSMIVRTDGTRRQVNVDEQDFGGPGNHDRQDHHLRHLEGVNFDRNYDGRYPDNYDYHREMAMNERMDRDTYHDLNRRHIDDFKVQDRPDYRSPSPYLRIEQRRECSPEVDLRATMRNRRSVSPHSQISRNQEPDLRVYLQQRKSERTYFPAAEGVAPVFHLHSTEREYFSGERSSFGIREDSRERFMDHERHLSLRSPDMGDKYHDRHDSTRDHEPFERSGIDNTRDREQFERSGIDNTRDREQFERSGIDGTRGRELFERSGIDGTRGRELFERSGIDNTRDQEPLKRSGRDSTRDPIERSGRDSTRDAFERSGIENHSNQEPFERTGRDNTRDREPFERSGRDNTRDQEPFERSGRDSTRYQEPFERSGIEIRRDEEPLEWPRRESSLENYMRRNSPQSRISDPSPSNKRNRSQERSRSNHRRRGDRSSSRHSRNSGRSRSTGRHEMSSQSRNEKRDGNRSRSPHQRRFEEKARSTILPRSLSDTIRSPNPNHSKMIESNVRQDLVRHEWMHEDQKHNHNFDSESRRLGNNFRKSPERRGASNKESSPSKIAAANDRPRKHRDESESWRERAPASDKPRTQGNGLGAGSRRERSPPRSAPSNDKPRAIRDEPKTSREKSPSRRGPANDRYKTHRDEPDLGSRRDSSHSRSAHANEISKKHLSESTRRVSKKDESLSRVSRERRTPESGKIKGRNSASKQRPRKAKTPPLEFLEKAVLKEQLKRKSNEGNTAEISADFLGRGLKRSRSPSASVDRQDFGRQEFDFLDDDAISRNIAACRISSEQSVKVIQDMIKKNKPVSELIKTIESPHMTPDASKNNPKQSFDDKIKQFALRTDTGSFGMPSQGLSFDGREVIQRSETSDTIPMEDIDGVPISKADFKSIMKSRKPAETNTDAVEDPKDRFRNFQSKFPDFPIRSEFRKSENLSIMKKPPAVEQVKQTRDKFKSLKDFTAHCINCDEVYDPMNPTKDTGEIEIQSNHPPENIAPKLNLMENIQLPDFETEYPYSRSDIQGKKGSKSAEPSPVNTKESQIKEESKSGYWKSPKLESLDIFNLWNKVPAVYSNNKESVEIKEEQKNIIPADVPASVPPTAPAFQLDDSYFNSLKTTLSNLKDIESGKGTGNFDMMTDLNANEPGENDNKVEPEPDESECSEVSGVLDPSLEEKLNALRFYIRYCKKSGGDVALIDAAIQDYQGEDKLKKEFRIRELHRIREKVFYTGALYIGGQFFADVFHQFKYECKSLCHEEAVKVCRNCTMEEIRARKPRSMDELREFLINQIKESEKKEWNTPVNIFKRFIKSLKNAKNVPLNVSAKIGNAVNISKTSTFFTYKDEWTFSKKGERMCQGQCSLAEILIGVSAENSKKVAKQQCMEMVYTRFMLFPAEQLVQGLSAKEIEEGLKKLNSSSADTTQNTSLKIVKENMDLLIDHLKRTVEDTNFIEKLDKLGTRLKVPTLCVFRKTNTVDKNNVMIIRCELYVADYLVAVGSGSSRNAAKVDAYTRCNQFMIATNAQHIILNQKKLAPADLTAADVLSTDKGQPVTNRESNKKHLKNYKSGEQTTTVRDIVILETASQKKNHWQNAFKILEYSCRHNQMLMEWECVTEGSNFKFPIYIQGEEVSSRNITAPTKHRARILSCADTLYSLYESRPVIEVMKEYDTEGAFSSEDIEQQAKMMQMSGMTVEELPEDILDDLEEEQDTSNFKWLYAVLESMFSIFDNEETLEELTFGPNFKNFFLVKYFKKKYNVRYNMLREKDGNVYHAVIPQHSPTEMYEILKKCGGVSGRYKIIPNSELPLRDDKKLNEELALAKNAAALTDSSLVEKFKTETDRLKRVIKDIVKPSQSEERNKDRNITAKAKSTKEQQRNVNRSAGVNQSRRVNPPAGVNQPRGVNLPAGANQPIGTGGSVIVYPTHHMNTVIPDTNVPPPGYGSGYGSMTHDPHPSNTNFLPTQGFPNSSLNQMPNVMQGSEAPFRPPGSNFLPQHYTTPPPISSNRFNNFDRNGPEKHKSDSTEFHRRDQGKSKDNYRGDHFTSTQSRQSSSSSYNQGQGLQDSRSSNRPIPGYADRRFNANYRPY